MIRFSVTKSTVMNLAGVIIFEKYRRLFFSVLVIIQLSD